VGIGAVVHRHNGTQWRPVSRRNRAVVEPHRDRGRPIGAVGAVVEGAIEPWSGAP
jgi:hypothetical protein